MRSLDWIFVVPTARRQVIRDTSIRVGSIKQSFSDLSFSVTPPSCSTLSPGAWVVTSIHLGVFAQSRMSLCPFNCEAARALRQASRRRRPGLFRFELFGLTCCLTGTAARPLRHEHGLQQSKHPRALRASLPGSCPSHCERDQKLHLASFSQPHKSAQI